MTRLALILAILFLVACGGGSSSSGNYKAQPVGDYDHVTVQYAIEGINKPLDVTFLAEEGYGTLTQENTLNFKDWEYTGQFEKDFPKELMLRAAGGGNNHTFMCRIKINGKKVLQQSAKTGFCDLKYNLADFEG